MQILSLCPLPVAHLYWRPRPGAVALTVVCKATYDLLPGEARLAQQQDYPNDDDHHWNDDPKASLYSPSDLAPFKPRADVLLVGSAFAPKDKPARSLMTRMVVGTVDKSIEVTRDRHWTQAGELVEGKRFVQMPLRWERAAGGPESSNPVGVDRYGERDAYGRLLAPNLQPPGVNVATPTDAVEPVCFGPIAQEWPLRRALLGRHAAAWSRRAWNAEVLPTDIDGGYFNAAPPDQRVEEIRPNERMLLEFLHPDEPHLVTQLPGLRPRAFIERAGAVRELPLRADTLWIDTDRAVCCVTWRGRVELESEHEAGRVLVALEEPGKTLGWPEVQRLAAEHDARGAGPKTAPKAGQDVARTDPLGERIDPSARLRPSFPRAAPDREATAVGAMRPAAQTTPLPFMHRAVPPPSPPPPSTSPDSARVAKTGALPVMHPDDRSPAWLMQSVVTQAPPELRALGQKPPPPPVPPPPPP
ncbi:MAG: DUF2169 domain-containing protein, partial [Myxococcales bacterium]|nr:DUF2169 domain-containing protein [Myxococcales bacterium]